jgi:hypothetical protein
MAIGQPDTVAGKAVNMRRLVDPAAICTDGMRRVVVAHDEKYVRLHVLSVLLCTLCEHNSTIPVKLGRLVP